MGGVRYFHSVFGYKRRLLMLNVRSFTIDFVYVCVLEWFLSELLKSLISLCLAKHPPVSSNCGGVQDVLLNNPQYLYANIKAGIDEVGA